jgi:ABC-type transport system involved in cytochrome c biogenesis permease subunit
MFSSAEIERLLVIASVIVLYSVAVLALVARRRAIDQTVLIVAMNITLVFLATAIWTRWIRENQGPFLTMYDILLSNLFSLLLVYALVLRFEPVFRPSLVVVAPFLAGLGSWLLQTSSRAEPLPPTFDNPWLWAHVVSGKLFFALCMTIAGMCAVLYWRGLRDEASLRSDLTREIDQAVWQVASFAFACQSLMLVAGAVWAHSAWGRYWAWDPLETWALLTWLCLGLLLHVRLTFKRIPAPYMWTGIFVVFGLAFLTFLGIPFVSIAPHKGVL